MKDVRALKDALETDMYFIKSEIQKIENLRQNLCS